MDMSINWESRKTKALRHEVHHVSSPPGFDFEKNGVHTSDGDNAIYFRPETGNSILIGSEDPECDPKEWIPNPDEFNREITDSQWKAQVYRCMRRIPNLEEPSRKRGVVDLYDVSDDWLPIYDSTRIKGYYSSAASDVYKRQTLNMGFYSRNREINPNSSFSVNG